MSGPLLNTTKDYGKKAEKSIRQWEIILSGLDDISLDLQDVISYTTSILGETLNPEPGQFATFIG
jgi:hypothetical protein